MSRNDISDFLIHFTKGDTTEDAFGCLQKIVREETLLGSSRLIKGEYVCVCFSEAPICSLAGGLVNPDYYSKYSPFGIMVHKQWLFRLGGRPVIYEPDEEFAALPESHRWRHMRYEPPEVDFSWEREWRIQCDSLRFDGDAASIVVLDGWWAERLEKEHHWEQETTIALYSTIMEDYLAQAYYEPFQWKIATLR